VVLGAKHTDPTRRPDFTLRMLLEASEST
jgi:hypothetical protein